MKSKKGTTGADYISFVIFGIFGTFIIMAFVLFLFIPSMEGEMEYKIKTEMDNLQSNLFLLYYLDCPIISEDISDIITLSYVSNDHTELNPNIADIISYSYANNDYTQLRSKTTNMLKELYGEEVGWKIIINDEEVVEQCDNSRCRGRSMVYSTILPSMIPDAIIKFKIRIYGT